MNLGIPHRTTAVWAVLLVSTCLSWRLGTDHGARPAGVKVMACAVVFIAFLKMYLVGSDFMELRHAPWPLRALFTAWVTVLSIACSTIYLL